MNSPLITVIIPVYNANASITQTLSSVIRQTLKNWECICINDGSKDTSAEVLESLIRCDHRIKGIHQRNAGASAARNRGLVTLSGETLFFLDADDTLNPPCFNSLYTAWQTTHANWCSCERTLHYKNGTIETSLTNQDRVILRDEFLKQYNWIETSVVWGKLFDASWFKKNHLYFITQLCVAEDSLLMAQAICRADKIMHLGSCNGYNYFVSNTTGLMQRAATKYPLMHMHAFEQLLNEQPSSNPIVRHQQLLWMDIVRADALKIIKQKKWKSLIFPTRFTFKTWWLALSSPKRLLAWTFLFVFKPFLNKTR